MRNTRRSSNPASEERTKMRSYRFPNDDDDDDEDGDLDGGCIGSSTCDTTEDDDPDPPASALRDFLMPHRSPQAGGSLLPPRPSPDGDDQGGGEPNDDVGVGVDVDVGADLHGDGEGEEYGYDDELVVAMGGGGGSQQRGLFSQPPPPTPPLPSMPGAMGISLGLTENDDEDASDDEDGTTTANDDEDHGVDEMTMGSASVLASDTAVDTQDSCTGARSRVGRGVFDPPGCGLGQCTNDGLGLTEDPTQSSSRSAGTACLTSDYTAAPLALTPAAKGNGREGDENGDEDHVLPDEEKAEGSQRELPVHPSSQKQSSAVGPAATKEAETAPVEGTVSSQHEEGTTSACAVQEVDVQLTDDATPLFSYPKEGGQQHRRGRPSQQQSRRQHRGVGVGQTTPSGDTTVLNTPLTSNLTPPRGGAGRGDGHDDKSRRSQCRSPNLLSMVGGDDTNDPRGDDEDGRVTGDAVGDGDGFGDRAEEEDEESVPPRQRQRQLQRNDDDHRRRHVAVRTIVRAMRMQRDKVRYFLVRTVLIWIQRRWREMTVAKRRKKLLAASSSEAEKENSTSSERCGIGGDNPAEEGREVAAEEKDAAGSPVHDEHDCEEGTMMTESPPHSYFDQQRTEALLPPPMSPAPPPRADDVVDPTMRSERDRPSPASAPAAGRTSSSDGNEDRPPRGGVSDAHRDDDPADDDDAAGGKTCFGDDVGVSPQVSVLLGESQQGSTGGSSSAGGSLTMSMSSCPTHYDGTTQTFACGRHVLRAVEAGNDHVGSEGEVAGGKGSTPKVVKCSTPATSNGGAVSTAATPLAPSGGEADRQENVSNGGGDSQGPGTTDRSTSTTGARRRGEVAASPSRATDGGEETTTGRGSGEDDHGGEASLEEGGQAAERERTGRAGEGGAPGGTDEVEGSTTVAHSSSVAAPPPHAPSSITGATTSAPRGVDDQVVRGKGQESPHPAMTAPVGSSTGGGGDASAADATAASAAGREESVAECYTCTRGSSTDSAAAARGGAVRGHTDILARIGEVTGTLVGVARRGPKAGRGVVEPSKPPSEPDRETLVDARSGEPTEGDAPRRPEGEEDPSGGTRIEQRVLPVGPDAPDGGIPGGKARVDSGIDSDLAVARSGKSTGARGIQCNTSDHVERGGNHAIGDLGADSQSSGGHAQVARREKGASERISSSTLPRDAREKGTVAKSLVDKEVDRITAPEEMEAPATETSPKDGEEEESRTSKSAATSNEESNLVSRPNVPAARDDASCPGVRRTGQQGAVVGDPDTAETETVVCSTIVDTICTPNDASSDNMGRVNGEHEGTEQDPDDKRSKSIRRFRVTFDVSDEEEHIASPPSRELSSSPTCDSKEQTPLLPLPSISFRSLTMGSADKAHGEGIGTTGSEKKAAREEATTEVIAAVSQTTSKSKNHLEGSKKSSNPTVTPGTGKKLKSKTAMKTAEKENSIPPTTDRNRPMMRGAEWLSTRRTNGQKPGKLRESNMSPSPLLRLPESPMESSSKQRAPLSASDAKDGDSIDRVAYDAADHGLQDTQEEEDGRDPSKLNSGKSRLSRLSRGGKPAIDCPRRSRGHNESGCFENVDNARSRTELVDDGESPVAKPKESPRKRRKLLARGRLPRGCSARRAEGSINGVAKTVEQRENSLNCSLQNFGSIKNDPSSSPKRLKVVEQNPQTDLMSTHCGDNERELSREEERIHSQGSVAPENAPDEDDVSLTQGELDLNALREEQKAKLREGQRSVRVLEKQNEQLAATLAKRREAEIRREQDMIRQEVARLKEENGLLMRENSKYKRKYSTLEEARQDDEKLMQQLSEERDCLSTRISLLQQCMKDVLTRYGSTNEGRTDVSFISDIARACSVSPSSTAGHQETSTTPKISNRVSTSSSGGMNRARENSKKSPQKKHKGVAKKRAPKVTEPRPKKGKKRAAVGVGNEEKCIAGGLAQDGATKKPKVAKGTKLQFGDCENAALRKVPLHHSDEPQGIKRHQRSIAEDEETIAASGTFQEAWALLQEHGWTYRAGPEPYNQVYVPPGGATKKGSKDRIDFFSCPKEMMGKAREMGHLLDAEQQSADEEEDAECSVPSRNDNDDNESDSSDEEHDEKEAVGVAWSLLQERGWTYKMGPQPYNKVYVPPGGSTKKGSKDGVHFFSCPRLAMEKAEVMGHLVDKEQQQSDGCNDEKDDPVQERVSVGQIEAEEYADEHNESAVTENVVSSSSSSSESESESEVAVLHSNLFTSASLRRCARYIRKFCRSGEDYKFQSQLWSPIWSALREQGGGNKKKCWSYKENRGNNLGSSWVFATPNSKGARHGVEGKDYFSTERVVVGRVLEELLCVFPDLVDEPSTKKIRDICAEESNDAVDALSFAEHAYANAAEAGNVALTVRCRRGRKPSFKARQQLEENADSRPTEKCIDREKQEEAKPKTTMEGESGALRNDVVAFSQNTLAGAEMLLGMQREDGHGEPQFEAEEDDDDNMPLCKLATPLAKTDAAVGLSSYSRVGTDTGVSAVLALRKEKQQRGRQRERVKHETNRKTAQVSAANGLERRTIPKVGPYHLTQSPQQSEDEGDTQESFTSPMKVGGNGDENAQLLHGLEFLLSGVPPHVKKDIVRLGGRVVEVLSDIPLDSSEIGGRLFFLSEPNCRRRLKYAFAVALGLPMLHYGVVKELEKRDTEFRLRESDNGESRPTLFSTALYHSYKLPVGSSISDGLFLLQRARHAKLWLAPGAENGGKPVFAGMRLIVALEDKDIEKDWSRVLKASGATIMSTSQALKIDHAAPDAVLVDCLSLPPHTTAAPAPVSKVLHAVKKRDGTMTPVVDLSWAIQCIVQRAWLNYDSNRRFRVLPDTSEMFSLKVKQGGSMHRYEVGDAVRFGNRSDKENYGRIKAIKPSAGRRGGRLLEISILEPHGRYSLVDDCNSVTMTICDDQLISQVVLLSARDFKFVKQGYATKRESNIFMQKQKTSTRKQK